MTEKEEKIRKEMIRMRGFIRAAETQAKKVVEIVDETEVEPTPDSESTPEPEPKPEPQPIDHNSEPLPTHFASPTGGGNGSEGSPFLISDFMEIAGPGDICCIVDAEEYRGPGSLIANAVRSGTPDRPITIRALNDGKVRIDGRGERVVDLVGIDHWIVQGFDMYNGGANVVRIRDGSHNVVKRVIAWDANPLINGSVFDVSGGVGNVFEDFAGFGIGRRIFQSSQFHRAVTWRRGWGQWERWDEVGVKKGTQIGYQGHEDLMENVIMTWDRSGGLTDGQRGAITLGRIDKPNPPDTNALTRVLGSIAYVLPGQEVGGLSQLVDVMTGTGGNEFRDLLLYSGQTNRPGRMVALREQIPRSRYTNVTEIGDVGASSIHGTWDVTNRVAARRVSDAPSPWGLPGSGARIMYRYINGVLTNERLWPWPMDSRIRAALKASGRNPDAIFGGAGNGVTGLLESIFGPISYPS